MLMRLATILGMALATWGCQPKDEMRPFEPPTNDYGKPLPPGQLALRQISPDQYPDFSRGFFEQAGLRTAVEHSLTYMAKPSSENYFPYGNITHDRVVESLEAVMELLDEAKTGEQFDRLIRERFDVYQSIGWDEKGTVLFTGYYTPIFDGRLKPDAKYRFPLYKMPPDLVKGPEGEILGRRKPDGEIVKYFTRREIEEQQLLEGTEIAWVKDPFEAYVITVQGSAKLRLEDGSLFEIGYAGNNGYDYSSVQQGMIEDGVIGRDEISLQRMIDYFRQNPGKVHAYCWKNDRYVFFREAKGGPFGSINAPVTPLRTIATDKSVFPRACVAFVTTDIARGSGGQVRQLPFSSLVLDQDTGGAIRAAGRCDIFMGIGDEAEAVAGHTYAEGQLYYLFVKPEYAP